jgi:YD repeat-containing protein
MMKEWIGLLCFLLLIRPAIGQYYFKDIIVPKQTTDTWKSYKDNKVSSVVLHSYEGNGQPTEGFDGKLTLSRDFSEISTYTRSDESQSSTLQAFYAANGLLTSTLDTSDRFQSTTDYTYNARGQLLTITNNSLETDNQVKESEAHIWNYDSRGIPQLMLKIKEGTDTTFVRFVADEKGNIIEERQVHQKDSLPVVYYYYDDQNRLTDIVRYNQRARRLLPDYVFEYDPQGRIASMLVVPEGNDYQKWIYQYNDRGLKLKESCFGKGSMLLGRIEYEYSYTH